MEELEIFIKLCNKQELIENIKLTNTKVNGFTKNFKHAPQTILKNSLKNRLAKKNYKYFFGLIKAISNSFEKFSLGDDFSSFILDVNRKKDVISQVEAFSIFLERFPKKKEKYLDQIKINIKNNNFIFDFEVEELKITTENVDQKFIELSGMNHLIDEFYDKYLFQLKEKLFKEEDKEKYIECKNKVKDQKWFNFVKLYPELIKNFAEKTIFLSYLETNQDLILEYAVNLKRIHLLIIYEVYLQLVIEENEGLENSLTDLINLNESLERKVDFLKKKDERETRANERLETKAKRLESEINEKQKKYKKEKNDLNILIKEKNKKIKNKENKIKKLEIENSHLINKKELLKSWGYSKKQNFENDLVIITYEDSGLFKLFFKHYDFIKSTANLNDLKQKLQTKKEQLIIINKAELNTQKLLEIESYIDSKKIIIISYTPQEFVTKTIKKLAEENLNIL